MLHAYQPGRDQGCRRRPKTKHDAGTTPAELTSATTAAHIHFRPRIWLAGRRWMSMSAATRRAPSATAVVTSSMRVRLLRSLHRRLAATTSSSVRSPAACAAICSSASSSCLRTSAGKSSLSVMTCPFSPGHPGCGPNWVDAADAPAILGLRATLVPSLATLVLIVRGHGGSTSYRQADRLSLSRSEIGFGWWVRGRGLLGQWRGHVPAVRRTWLTFITRPHCARYRPRSRRRPAGRGRGRRRRRAAACASPADEP